mgnify:CR=1 FL=1
MGVAAAELHEGVVAAGFDLACDGLGEAGGEGAVAELGDVFHQGAFIRRVSLVALQGACAVGACAWRLGWRLRGARARMTPRSRCGRRAGAGLGEQRQGLFGFFRIEPAEREADVHDHVVADRDVVDERERDRLAHAVELDDGVVTGEPFDDAGGDG